MADDGGITFLHSLGVSPLEGVGKDATVAWPQGKGAPPLTPIEYKQLYRPRSLAIGQYAIATLGEIQVSSTVERGHRDTVAARKTASGGEQDEAGEAWIRSADGERAVRTRVLNALLDKGRVVTEARLVEGLDGLWTIRLRLAGRAGEVLVNRFDSDEPRTYKEATLAIKSIWKDMRYRGAITVSTERDYGADG